MLRIPAALGVVALSLALTGSAVAAPSSTTGKPKPAKKASKKGGKSKLKAKAKGTARTEGDRPARTALTGDVKAQAEAAALAAVPGTVQGSYVAHACPGQDASASTAAYEVDVLKADGTVVHVIEDASFAVVDQRTGGPKPPKPTATTGS